MFIIRSLINHYFMEILSKQPGKMMKISLGLVNGTYFLVFYSSYKNSEKVLFSAFTSRWYVFRLSGQHSYSYQIKSNFI